MGRRVPGNPTSQKTNNSMEDSVGNEENEYPVPDSNKMVTPISSVMPTKKISQRGNYRRYQ
jgi:hypothetical protein